METVGAKTLCGWCGEPVGPGEKSRLMPHYDDAGYTEKHYHAECIIRTVVGGVNHLLKQCTCCANGDLQPDPEWMTKRTAARVAAAVWHELNAITETK